jgi:hypothetical protein
MTRTRRRGSTTTERKVDVKDPLAFLVFSLRTCVVFFRSLLTVLTSLPTQSTPYSSAYTSLCSSFPGCLLSPRCSLVSLFLFLSSKSGPACSVSSFHVEMREAERRIVESARWQPLFVAFFPLVEKARGWKGRTSKRCFVLLVLGEPTATPSPFSPSPTPRTPH